MDKKLVTVFWFLLFAAVGVRAQGQNFPSAPLNGSGPPGGACGNGVLYTDNLTGSVYTCKGGVYAGPAQFQSTVVVDGVNFSTLHDALASCPAAGCTIDMRGNSNAAALNLSTGFTFGIVDPGEDHSLTILLGPYTYTVTQILLESNMHIIGIGGGNSGSANHGTTLVASTSGVTPILNNKAYPVQSVILKGFTLLPVSSGSSSAGIASVPAANGNGLWYSELDNLCVGQCGGTADFAGGAILMDGTSGGSPNSVNQFINFNRVIAFHGNTAGHYAFWAKGQNAQFTFNNCEFDGDESHFGGTNIWIGDGIGGLGNVASTFSFNELTTQWADVCVDIEGLWKSTFHQNHMEQCKGAFKFANGATNGNIGIDIEDSYIATSGSNSGNGYIVAMGTSTSSVSFARNYIVNTPDHFYTGTTTGLAKLYNFGPGGNNTAINDYPVLLGAGPLQLQTYRGALSSGCTTTASAGDTCDTTVTFGTAYPDTLYTPVCNGFGITQGVPIDGGVATVATDHLTYRTVAGTAAAAEFIAISCIIVHD